MSFPTFDPTFDAAALAGGLLVKATLVILLGGLVALALSRASAAARHLAWAVTVAGLLALPALAVWGPALELPVLPEASASAGHGARAVPVADEPAARGEIASVTPPASRASARSADRPASAPASGPTRARWAVWAYALYLAGAVGLLLYLAAGWARAVWLGRWATPVDGGSVDSGWCRRVATLCREAGLRRPVSVRVSEGIAVPLAYGLRRPVILLPAAALEGGREWAPAQLRDVLRHELAHVARNDWPVQLVARIACALYWFHPLVWWGARRLALEAERACDDRVLLAGSDSCDYAERLLRVAAAGRSFAEPSYAAVAMARRTDLATRVRSILDGRVRRGRPGALPVLLVALALLAPVTALATARLAPAETPPPDEATAPVDAFDAGWGADRDRDSDTDREHDRDHDARVVEGTTPLLAAVWRRDRDAVRSLLAGGADPNVVVDGDGTPLTAAISAGDEELARLLLDGGADPALSTPGDGSPLFHAAHGGQEEMTLLLLDAGADPNAEISGDGNALIVAAREGHLDVVDLLVRAGADVDRVVPGDENPLIRAAGGGHLEVARYLLDAGADPNARVVIEPNPFQPDGDVRTPLSMARRGGHADVVELLLARGARE